MFFNFFLASISSGVSNYYFGIDYIEVLHDDTSCDTSCDTGCYFYNFFCS